MRILLPLLLERRHIMVLHLKSDVVEVHRNITWRDNLKVASLADWIV